MTIGGQIVDIINRTIFNGEITIRDGIIKSIVRVDKKFSNFILPGLVDSHVHIESSMLTPCFFSELVVPRGTVAVVTDPHEIANVAGIKGVNFMINDSKNTPLKCFFGAPSCVPATSFESSGAVIQSDDIDALMQKKEVCCLSEMMNFPGVVNNEKEVWDKINIAHKYNKPIDGHAPGLKGAELDQYIKAGISTDHECVSVEEAVEKINKGVIVQIREGSAAKNFQALLPLFDSHPDNIMLCTDDSHPDEIVSKGHIDKIIRLGLKEGIDIFKLLRAAILKPIQHYNLPVGLLREGDAADFIVVDNLDDFNIIETFIDGNRVYSDGKIRFNISKPEPINNFNIDKIAEEDIKVNYVEGKRIRVIGAVNGDLLTEELVWSPTSKDGFIDSDIQQDILKIVVVNRYKQCKPVVGFIKNIGLKKGAIACSIAHDSHNLIAVGVSDSDIVDALNIIIENKGGISCSENGISDILPLEVGGLMTSVSGKQVAKQYQKINSKAFELGATLSAPFMTLSFMSLLVIPNIKIGDKGLFDVTKFSFTNLYTE
ncbi:adenine deaminase [Plebeiibacterium marinum]|uniref:Adenine deaminase n=1 Tax=Plebeiibacterium marinum TaxID=2992111 RepID=A0AAE3MFR6_9BACT|nr:adenine deaminase [Plebeiobacterium marinum]MCW3807004.1 adenine deaminase [Plebeiobacterium marinum]